MYYQSVMAQATERRPAPHGPQARRQREIEQLRHKILDAAEEILVKEGYDNLSMRHLANAIEYAASTIYSYFPDKRAILSAVIERTSGALTDALDRAAATPGPLTRLRMLGRAYVEFALEYPRHYEVLFLLRGQAVPRIESPAFTAAIGFFRQAVDEGVRKGVFRRCDPDETAQAFWAACHGLVGLLLTHSDHFDFAPPARLLESLLTLQIEGLRPQAFGLTAAVRPVEARPEAEAEPANQPAEPALPSV